MMDRIEAMSLLVAVSETGSFSAASRSLRMPVTTVTRKISELEAFLKTRLLTRTTRKLSLTDAGMGYLKAAKRILEQVDEAEREAAGVFSELKGDLVLTAPMMFGRLYVLPIVSEFLKLFPQIDIRLHLGDRNVHLVDDHVDMAVRIGRLPDSAMSAIRVGSMRTVVCASPGFLALHGEPQSPRDLLKLPCVTADIPTPALAWRFLMDGSVAPIQIPVKPRLSVTTTDAAVSAAIQGTGAVRLLYYQVANAVEAGSLKIILSAFEPEPSPIHLVHVGRGQMPLKTRRFMDFAAPRLRSAMDTLIRV